MSDNEATNGDTKGLREAYDAKDAELKALRAEHAQLLATTTFEKSGLNPKHAELFLRVNGDQPITVEAAKKFAEDYGLNAVPAPAEPAPAAPAQAPQNTNLASMSGAATPPAGGSNTPQGAKMSQAEFQKLYQNDQAAAVKAYTEGRVEHAEGNPIVAEAKQKGLIA